MKWQEKVELARLINIPRREGTDDCAGQHKGGSRRVNEQEEGQRPHGEEHWRRKETQQDGQAGKQPR